MKRPLSVVARAGLAATAPLVLAGCAALTSPATIIEPYDAGDGTTLKVPGSNLTLANFLVVGSAQGQAAEVSGSVINAGASPVTLTLAAGATGPTEVTVGGNSLVRIGPDQVYSVSLPSLPVAPGATMQLTAQTPSVGSTAITVPVLRPVGYYNGLTPSPVPSPTAAARRARSSDATATPSATATPTS